MTLWRESLLARAVLEGKTRGYANHPQLERFKDSENPLASIETYLYYVLEEAKRRGFGFDDKKIEYGIIDKSIKIPISQGQLDYELALLKYKLKARSIDRYKEIADYERGEPNGLFESYKGPAEAWEKARSYLIPK